jgi:hypothetical protein
MNGKSNEPPTYPAEKARQREIILRMRMRRAIFIAGLVGVGILAFIIDVLSRR